MSAPRMALSSSCSKATVLAPKTAQDLALSSSSATVPALELPMALQSALLQLAELQLGCGDAG